MPLLAQSPASYALPWQVFVPLALAVAALYLLLPKPRRRPVLLASLLGLAAVVAAGFALERTGRAPLPERVLFYAFSGLAILGGGFMLSQRRPGRAAISFAFVVMNVCGLFLLQGAPFLMAATIIIYAGAIIVTFLFVLMLAQQRGFSAADDRTREPFLATFAGFVLLGTLLLMIDQAYPDLAPLDGLVAKAEAAARKDSLAEVEEAIGDRHVFAAALLEQDARLHGPRSRSPLESAVTDLQAEWGAARPDLADVKARLRAVADAGRRVLNDAGPKRLPAANVAGLGKRLYAEHLLAVEMGGTLLLVAAVGAIAITGRGPRRRP